MLDQLSNLPDSLIPIGVFISSLIGSWHCAGMCGPIACTASLNGNSHLYHTGRLLSYVSLGALAGYLGNHLFALEFVSLRFSSTALMAIILFSLGFSFFFGWKVEKLPWTRPFLKVLLRYKDQKFLLGLFTALLPCGWLYSFVAASAATHSLSAGALTMFLFWLGTVPALTFLTSGFKNLLIKSELLSSNKNNLPQKIIGIIFILSGLYSLFAHIFFHH